MAIEQVSEEIRRAAAALRDFDVSDLSSPDVGTALRELRSERSLSSRLELALTARAAELHHSGTGDDPIDLLTGVGAMPQRRARQVLGHTELLARMPVLAAALRAGTITADHVDAVACAQRRIDPALRTGFDGEDAAIGGCACGHSPDQLADWLRWLVRRLETGHSRDLAVRRKRAVRVRKWVDHTGMYRLDGTFDPEMGAGIFTAIDTAVDALRKHPGEVVPGEDPTDPLGNDGEFLAAHASSASATPPPGPVSPTSSC